jgi:hypothetical protein
MMYLGNHPDRIFQYNLALNVASASSHILPKDSIIKSYKSLSDFTASMKNVNGETLKWKEKKKMLKEQVKRIKKANDLSKSEKTLLGILSVLVALGLIFLKGVLSCNLACNGSGGAAALVLVGETVAIVILFVIAIRAIYGKRGKNKKTAKPSPGVN